MKKNAKPFRFDPGRLKKVWLMSKYTLVFVLLGVLTSYGSAYSQNEQQVTLALRDAYLKDVLWAIERQTPFTFMYNKEDLDKVGKMDALFDQSSIDQILSVCLKGTGLTYVIQDDVIVLKPLPSQQVNLATVTGKVTDEKGNPIPGVTVALKGLSVGTSTRTDGTYRLVLPRGDNFTLVFTFIGMERQEVKYTTGKETINVKMRESTSQLEEVIVSTGYQQINLRETTSSIQSLKAEEIVVAGLTTIDQMLEGHVPGMIFMQNSGQIGAAPRLRIRGTSTILGSQEPLWVIDGIVQQNPVDIDPSQINDLDFVNLLGNAISGLNPEDVEQIDILKDASATALYGARAANGVIVVTTKRGKPGPPTLSYSLSGTFMTRPHYSDASVNMMNSVERIDFSRDMFDKRVTYPQIDHWLGYEKAMVDYWSGNITYDEMQREIARYEAVNTDWFDILMQNSFSHKHTLNLSGGSSELRYYVSAGFDDTRGSIREEKNKRYTASVNLTANYNRWVIRFTLNANVGRREYTPNDVDVTRYAYETTRALPAYNDDGSLWYYPRSISSNTYRDFNIIYEKENSSQDIRSSGITATAVLDYKISDALKFAFTGSYSTNNTTQETWHGEKTYYAERLRQPPSGYTDRNGLPFGGELIYQNTERYSYTVRGQLNFNQHLDENKKHFITSSVGGEISSNQYYSLDQTYRGYLKERGKKMAQVTLTQYPYFAEWLGTNRNALGIWADKLTNIASAYATLSYTYNNLYSVNANVRIDGSNRFGSRANEKLAPIWSFSARWDIKNDLLQSSTWVDNLALKGSFGYQGNMLENQSSKMIIERQGMDADFQEYESSVLSYANPDLKWEKTASYNTTVDFGLLRNSVAGSVSYFYKKTADAFLNKSISSVNGVRSWVVNQGTVENQGIEIALQFTPINTKTRNINGIRWTLNTNFGQTLNKISGTRDKSLTNEINYSAFLDGTAQVQGRPVNSFYSYKYLHLNPLNGMPMFYGLDQVVYVNNQRVDLLEKYQDMELTDIFSDVMSYSGTRVPTIQGGVQNSVAWRRFSLAMNLTYSVGSKIRLLQMYPNVSGEFRTVAPQPTANVRKEFLDRWQNPGDELHTNVPGVISGDTFLNTLDGRFWWDNKTNMNGESIKFAGSIWSMYDKSDFRTVSGSFVKIQSVSIRYNLTDRLCNELKIRSAYIGMSGTNLHTFCDKRLKGQDPATQDGTAPTINLSLRPTFSFNLNVSF